MVRSGNAGARAKVSGRSVRRNRRAPFPTTRISWGRRRGGGGEGGRGAAAAEAEEKGRGRPRGSSVRRRLRGKRESLGERRAATIFWRVNGARIRGARPDRSRRVESSSLVGSRTFNETTSESERRKKKGRFSETKSLDALSWDRSRELRAYDGRILREQIGRCFKFRYAITPHTCVRDCPRLFRKNGVFSRARRARRS